MIVSTNPTTDVELARFTPQSPQEVDDILDKVADAQAAWRRRDISDRTPLLREVARVLREGRDAYAALITAEMGKPITEARAEIEKCAMTCEYYAEHAPAQLADRPVASNAAESAVVYDPLGVVLAVMPWNYPFWQFFRFAAPALAAGNGTLLKHANNVPQCALAVEEIVRKAGAPADLCRTLLIEVDQVAGFIADPRVAAVTLTGSTEVGAIVASQAAAVLKKQVLELGGSDPFIVLADADIEQAAATAVKARYVNVGQSCVNAKRFIVEAAVADRFAAAFTTAAAALKVGDPADPDTAIGPMARAHLRDTLHDQVRRTVDAGAVLVLGGKVPDGPGCYYPPTVLDHVRPGMAAFEEETFGPVAAITRVASADEAVTLANQTEYGLGAALWTSDPDRARRLARVLDAGAVFINGMVASDPRLPFGGIKRSGCGRELGAEGIREFVNTKTVWIGPAAPTA
ncbi:NAD-dependent succinate-semialdehyde dehydrogenase [Streptomyces collinus]